MELLLISENKLKISLSAADMEAYALRCEDLDYRNTETRRVFWSILDRAKHETGFDAASERVLVQVYPSVCGGCELFVTKMSGCASTGLEKLRERLTAGSGRKTLQVWRFPEFGSLLAACGCLRSLPGICGSSAYAEEGKGYLLFLTCRESENGLLPGFYPTDRLREYGSRLNASAALLRAPEHCSLLADGNAVERLSALI